MWTKSSSRADLIGFLALATLVVFPWGCTPGDRTASTAPDAPLPALEAAAGSPRAAAEEGRAEGPVEVAKAAIRSLEDDAELRTLAGEAFLAKARKPYVIEVETARPLGNLWQSSAPVILLNGQILPETYATSQTTLVAFLADRQMLQERNEIAVAWAGNLEATRSRKAVMVVPEG